jgi:hypothetical protein
MAISRKKVGSTARKTKRGGGFFGLCCSRKGKQDSSKNCRTNCSNNELASTSNNKPIDMDKIPVEDMNTVEELNAWIGKISKNLDYPLNAASNIVFAHVGSNAGTLGPSFDSISQGQLMHASGNNNDCLIHSFLTCTSENFRRLKTQYYKDTIASVFRRKLLTRYASQGLLHINPAVDNLVGSNFLSDEVGRELSRKFNVNILWVQKPRQVRGKWQRASAMLTAIDEESSVIVIHGNMYHFTPVQLPIDARIEAANPYAMFTWAAQIVVASTSDFKGGSRRGLPGRKTRKAY